MRIRYKVEVKELGSGFKIKSDPVLQFQDCNDKWVDVVVEEVEVELTEKITGPT